VTSRRSWLVLCARRCTAVTAGIAQPVSTAVSGEGVHLHDLPLGRLDGGSRACKDDQGVHHQGLSGDTPPIRKQPVSVHLMALRWSPELGTDRSAHAHVAQNEHDDDHDADDPNDAIHGGFLPRWRFLLGDRRTLLVCPLLKLSLVLCPPEHRAVPNIARKNHWVAGVPLGSPPSQMDGRSLSSAPWFCQTRGCGAVSRHLRKSQLRGALFVGALRPGRPIDAQTRAARSRSPNSCRAPMPLCSDSASHACRSATS